MNKILLVPIAVLVVSLGMITVFASHVQDCTPGEFVTGVTFDEDEGEVRCAVPVTVYEIESQDQSVNPNSLREFEIGCNDSNDVLLDVRQYSISNVTNNAVITSITLNSTTANYTIGVQGLPLSEPTIIKAVATCLGVN